MNDPVKIPDDIQGMAGKYDGVRADVAIPDDVKALAGKYAPAPPPPPPPPSVAKRVVGSLADAIQPQPAPQPRAPGDRRGGTATESRAGAYVADGAPPMAEVPIPDVSGFDAAPAPRRGGTRAEAGPSYGAGDNRVSAPKPRAANVLDRPVSLEDRAAWGLPAYEQTALELASGQSIRPGAELNVEEQLRRNGQVVPGERNKPGASMQPVPQSWVDNLPAEALKPVADTWLAGMQIVPQTLKLATDIAQIITLGGAKPLSDALEKWSEALGGQMSFEKQQQTRQFQGMLQNANVSPAQVTAFLLQNPGFTTDMAIPSMGSMLVGVGGAKVGQQVAMVSARRAGVVGKELAAAGKRGAALGANLTNALMNAGNTFDQTEGGLAQKMLAAAGAAGTTALVGKLTGGGAEGQIARGAGRPLSQNPVVDRIGRTAMGTGKEFTQETGEQLGQDVSQGLAEGQTLDPNTLAKSATAAGIQGAVLGAAAGLGRPGRGIALDGMQAAIDLAGQRAGMGPKATAALREAVVKMTPDDALTFVERALNGLEARGLAKRPGAATAFKEVLAQQQAEAEAAVQEQAAAAQPAAPGAAPQAEDFTGLAGTGDHTAQPLPTDILTSDGMPYGSRAAAQARANKEGGDIAPVQGGWVVRPQGAESEPVSDVAVPAVETPQAGDAGSDPAARSSGAVGSVSAEPAGVVLPATAPAAGAGAPAPVGNAGRRNRALTDLQAGLAELGGVLGKAPAAPDAATALDGLAQQFDVRQGPTGKGFAAVLRDYAKDVRSGKLTPEQVQPQIQAYTDMLDRPAPSAGAPINAPAPAEPGEAFRSVGQPDTKQPDAGAPIQSSADPRAEPASWVIREKATGAVVMETFDKAKVAALNTQRYEAVPIMEHLQQVARDAKAAPVNAPAPAEQGGAFRGGVATQAPDAGAPSNGERYQLDGKSWNVTAAHASHVMLADDAGKKRRVGAKGETYAKLLQLKAAGNVEKAPTRTAGHPATVMGSTMLADISAAMGGLDPKLLSEFSFRIDTKRKDKRGGTRTDWRNPMVPGVGKLFRAGGAADYELIAERLEGSGYLSPGTVAADPKAAGERAKELVKAALNRETTQTMDEELADRQAAEDAEREAYYAQQEAKQAAELENERLDILAAQNMPARDLAALDDDDLGLDFASAAPEQTDDVVAAGMRSMGFTEQEIADELAERQGKAAQARAPAAGQDGAQGQGKAAGNRTDAAQPAGQEGAEEGLTLPRRRELEGDFTARSTEVLEELGRRGELPALFRALGMRSMDAFTGEPISDQARAYADHIESGAKPVTFAEDYNTRVERREREAVTRRLQSDREVRQANGKPFKTVESAGEFCRKFDLTGTHEPRQVAGGFILHRISPAEQAERKRIAESRESYSEAQAAVAAEMGIGENADGEWGATDAQFAEMERRVRERMRRPPAVPELLLEAPTPATLRERAERADNADELDARAQLDRESDLFGLEAQTAPDTRRDTTGDLFGGPSVADVEAAAARERAKASSAPAPDDLFSQAEEESAATPAPAPAPAAKPTTTKVEPGDSETVRQAKANLMAGLGDLASLLTKNTRKNIAPEEEQRLLPILTKVMDAAFNLGYLKFKDAAKFVLDQIRNALGNEAADAITLDHLQGAYIGMSGRYKDEGASSKKDVVAVEDMAEVLAHQAQNAEQEAPDVSDPSPDLERDSLEPGAEDAPVAPAVQGDRPTSRPGTAGGAGGSSRRGRPDTQGVPPRRPAAAGEPGNQPLFGEDRQDGPTEFDAGSDDDQRSDDPGIEGVPPDAFTAEDVAAAATGGMDDAAKRREQRAADSTPVTPGSLENIRATLPYLLPGQQEDVHKAEQRFAVPDGYGMLFTNGTGTGKTFTGLGVIKRFARQGKTDTLIVVPDDKIMADWVDSGRPLGLTITPLADTKDKGRGLTITTYANLGQNDALAQREWQLVVADEVHSLMQAADGKDTLALDAVRALTLHRRGVGARFSMLHRDELAEQSSLAERMSANNKLASADDTMEQVRASVLAENQKLEAQYNALTRRLADARKAIEADVEARQGLARTRLVGLSATPFAYHFTIDWAEGYLFDYGEGQTGQNLASGSGMNHGYNSGDWRDKFFMQHFGYRMRYNKLTQPDAKVDVGLMERQFNATLKKRGVLSGRMLDVDADYDRRFVLVESAVGNAIDQAIDWVHEQSKLAREAQKGDPDAHNGFSMLEDMLQDTLYGKLGHLTRRYLLEAIKAREVIPHIREHLAMGRKIVVFHDFNKGGSTNPFAFPQAAMLREGQLPEGSLMTVEQVNAQRAAYNQAAKDFARKFPELASDRLMADLVSPIQRFTREFPDVLLINGTQKKGDLLARYKAFNDDNTGPVVALVQSDKNKGWSGHDTTGKHQRVLFNLGLPTQPTKSIQQEGRIYRTGQVTDAMFRYLNTGTNWERWAFAETIAKRASTAENLGMGELARALKDSYITAFEESDDYRAGHEDEGKGGKESDRLANAALTEFDSAKTFYFGTQKKNAKTKAAEGVDYYATPEPLGLKMTQWADGRGGEDALEPSGGHGAIARWFGENLNRTAIEPSSALGSRLALVFDGEVIQGTFEDYHVVNKADVVAMNPPFGSAGRTAVDHVAKAATHLREWGRIVALIPMGSATQKFDKWFYEESTRPAKPVATVDLGMGEEGIYVGDAIKSTQAWQDGRVLGRSAGGALRVKTEAPGETLVPESNVRALARTGKRMGTYKPAEGLYLAAEILLPAVTFERAGTGVMTRIVIIDKLPKDARQLPMQRMDLTDAKDITELFDRLEFLEVRPRLKPVEEAKPDVREQLAQAVAAKQAARVAGAQLADQQQAAVVEHTTGKGKLLKGVIRTDLTMSQAKEVDKFTFKKNGGWFIRVEHLPALSEKYPPPDAVKFSRRDVAAELNIERAPDSRADVRAAKKAMSRIERAGGVTSPDDLAAVMKVGNPGRWFWRPSRVATSAQRMRELDAAIRQKFGGTYNQVQLSAQGVISFARVPVNATEFLAKVTALADKFDAPVGMRGLAQADRPEVVRALRAAGFENYTGVVGGPGRFAMVRPGGGFTRATPMFSRGATGDQGAARYSPTPQEAARVQALNGALVQYGLGPQWADAFEAAALPDSLSGIREALQAAFRRDIQPVAPTAAEFNVFNGVYIPGQPQTVYVNTQAEVGFVQVAGHELWHTIERTRPELADWFLQQAEAYWRGTDAYAAKLNALLEPGEKPYTTDKAKREMAADFMGDGMADPKFLQQLAAASPSKFRDLLNRVRVWLAGVAYKLKGLKSDRYVNDVQALRSYLQDVLVAYAEGKPLAEVQDGPPVFQRVWHGTPYRGIEQFSTDAIGTGEGQQAYGWGLYFAGRREVADYYRRKLAGDGSRAFTKVGKTIDTTADLMEAYYQPGRIVRGYGGADKVLEFQRDDARMSWGVKVVGVKANGDPMASERPRWHSTQPDAAALKDVLEEDGWEASNPGQLYEVEIPEDSDMLLWNKPLSEQPTKAREALAKLGGAVGSLVAVADAGVAPHYTGATFYQAASSELGGDPAASQALLAAGIKGIKYLDGTSRAAGDGSFNYVIFDGADTQVVGAQFSRRASENAAMDADGYVERIEPPHEVRDDGKLKKLAAAMKERGWQGRPVLAYRAPNGRIQALTGSHRIAAASLAGIEIPLVYVDQNATKWEDKRGLFPDWPGVLNEGDDRIEAFLRMAGDSRSAMLMQDEMDSNSDGMGAWASEFSASNQDGAPMFSRRAQRDPVTEEALRRAGVGRPGTAKEKIKASLGAALDMVRDRDSLASEFRQGALDQFHGIQRAIVRDVGNLPAEQDPYVAARLANGGVSSVMRGLLLHGQAMWAANGQHLEKKPGTKGLLEIFEPLGQDLQDFFGWMVGNRAARLKREGRENNLSDDHIAALQALPDTPEKLAKFRQAATEYAGFKRSVLDVAQAAGLIEPGARAVWDHADYIPFYREMDERAVFSATGKKGLSHQSSGIRMLRGGASKLNDPMENLLMNFSRLIDASIKNNAIKRTVQLLDKHDSDAVQKVGLNMTAALIPTEQVRKLLIEGGTDEAVLDAIPPEVFEGIAKMWALQAPTDKDVIRVMVGGKATFYRVNDPLLLRALTSFEAFDFPGLATMRAAKRLLTSMVTATPEFMLRNWIRDSVAAQAIGRTGFNPLKSITGVVESFRETGAGEAMLFAGASFQGGNVNAANPEAAATAMRRALRRKGMSASDVDGLMATMLDSPLRVWEKYREISDAIENANREAIYEATASSIEIVNGVRTDLRTRAAYEAKDLMDFSLRGSWAAYQLLADVLPFFNARVQGLYRLGRSDPARLAAVGTALMVASLMLAGANDGEDWYEQLPDWDKDTSWHFRIGGHHFRIPKPFEIGVVFATIPERIGRAIKGLDGGSKTAGRLWANARDQLAIDPVPQLFRPALNVWANKDTFRDSPIEGMADEGKLPAQRFSARTSATARVAVDAIEPLANSTGLSPKKLEYLVGGYFGTVGLYALGLSDMVVRKLEGLPPGPSLRADDLPVVRAFYREDPARSTVFETDLFKMRTEVDQIYRTVTASLEQHPEKSRQLLQDNKAKLAVRSLVLGAAKAIVELGKERDRITLDPNLSPEEKRLRIDALQEKRNAIAQAVATNKAVREAF